MVKSSFFLGNLAIDKFAIMCTIFILKHATILKGCPLDFKCTA